MADSSSSIIDAWDLAAAIILNATACLASESWITDDKLKLRLDLDASKLNLLPAGKGQIIGKQIIEQI